MITTRTTHTDPWDLENEGPPPAGEEREPEVHGQSVCSKEQDLLDVERFEKARLAKRNVAEAEQRRQQDEAELRSQHQTELHERRPVKQEVESQALAEECAEAAQGGAASESSASFLWCRTWPAAQPLVLSCGGPAGPAAKVFQGFFQM